MTWTTAGSWLYAGNTSSIALTNQAAGNLLLIEVHNFQNTTVSPVSMTGGGATWVLLGTTFTSGPAGYNAVHAIFAGTVTATGSQTATVTWSGTAPTTNFLLEGREFHSSVGSWSLDAQGNYGQNSSNTWSLLAPGSAGELYFGSEVNASTAVGGSTPGYVYNVNAFACGAAYNLNCAQGVTTAPVWSDANNRTGIMVLMREGAAPVTLTNTFEAGTDGVTLTAGSGGNSGGAFRQLLR